MTMADQGMPPGAIPVNDPSLVGYADDIPGLHTADEPETLNAASEASLLAAAGPRPLMDPPAPGVVKLVGGWRAPDGSVYKDAVVREMTGRDEERMARLDPFEQPSLYYNTLMELGVESIGGFPATPEMIGSVLVGDKELLLLGIRTATYGNEKDAVVVCPDCDREMHVTFELDKDIPIRPMPTDGQFDYDLVTPSGKRVLLALPVAAVQDEMLANRALNDGEKRTLLLERCTLSIDGRPVNSETVKNLGMRDRKFLTEWLTDNQPGPDYEGVRLKCEGCARDIPVILDLADLFR